jgi:putative nucleotidyltransferase with HDIG domain
MICCELATFTGKAAPEIAYTAGLLHDIGKIPLDQYVAPVSPYFYRAAHGEGRDLCNIEYDHFGISHPEVGAILGERWSLPDNLIDCIRHHHAPEEADVDRDLATIVYMGDLLMTRFQVAHELERLNTDRFTKRLKRVGLSPEHFPIIIDRIPRAVFQGSPGEK